MCSTWITIGNNKVPIVELLKKENFFLKVSLIVELDNNSVNMFVWPTLMSQFCKFMSGRRAALFVC